MRINCINNYNYKKYPNFGSTYKMNPNNIHNTSWLFREDIDWYWLANFMNKHFEKQDKVNVINCACSDGSETYSLAIALNETMPIKEKRNKFLPIIASDIDGELIRNAKKGKINLREYDITAHNCLSGNSPQNYFDNPNFPIYVSYDCLAELAKSYEISPYLKFATYFKQSDIKTELLNLKDSGNTTLLMRNVTPYLPSEYLNQVVALLKEKLKPESLLILGDYDKYTPIESLLETHFKRVANNILKKIV